MHVYRIKYIYTGPLLYHWVEDVDQNFDQRYQKSVEVSSTDCMYIVYYSTCYVRIYLYYTYSICRIFTRTAIIYLIRTHTLYTYIYYIYTAYTYIILYYIYTVLCTLSYSYLGRRSSTS